MKHEIVNVMGMELERWTYRSCSADFGVGEESGESFATLYNIHSAEEGKGHATQLLTEAKKYYEKQGRVFGGSIALNDRMKRIYEKLGIKEYTE